MVMTLAKEQAQTAKINRVLEKSISTELKEKRWTSCRRGKGHGKVDIKIANFLTCPLYHECTLAFRYR